MSDTAVTDLLRQLVELNTAILGELRLLNGGAAQHSGRRHNLRQVDCDALALFHRHDVDAERVEVQSQAHEADQQHDRQDPHPPWDHKIHAVHGSR